MPFLGMSEAVRRAACCALLCAPAPLAAQQVIQQMMERATLVGVVRDSSGRAVPGVELRMRGDSGILARTNDSGGFRIASLPVGRVAMSARRLGFAPASFNLNLRAGQTDSLVLSLTMLAAQLPGVNVESEYDARSHRLLAGFWERRSRGFGHYMTRDEIVAKEAHDFIDLVRTTPSVMITTGRNGRKILLFGRGNGTRGECPPQYFVDGMRVEQMTPDELSPNDVEAIELYSGAATLPPQFAPRFNSYTCGAVVVWTRIPGT